MSWKADIQWTMHALSDIAGEIVMVEDEKSDHKITGKLVSVGRGSFTVELLFGNRYHLPTAQVRTVKDHLIHLAGDCLPS